MNKLGFATSKELRLFFNAQFERWKQRGQGGLAELAEKCGVSPSYLAQIGRYGRIPGRPVLILLALNFELKEPRELFSLASVKDDWPYATRSVIRQEQNDHGSFLSLKLDMEGFTDAIRGVLRGELRQRTLKDLLGSRPLRIGLNPTQWWMYDQAGVMSGRGFFPDFCQLLGVALQRDIHTELVPFSSYVEKLSRGEIDIYGPIMAAPNSPSEILFSSPIYKIGVSALMRNRSTLGLDSLPPPKQFEDLQDPRYQVAVLKHSLSHLIVNTRLKRPDSTLVLCESDEEAQDRILMRGIKNPAHVFICNAMLAQLVSEQHPLDVLLLFNTDESFIDLANNGLAIRPDWPEAITPLNDAIRFLLERGGLKERLAQSFHERNRASIRLVQSA